MTHETFSIVEITKGQHCLFEVLERYRHPGEEKFFREGHGSVTNGLGELMG